MINNIKLLWEAPSRFNCFVDSLHLQHWSNLGGAMLLDHCNEWQIPVSQFQFTNSSGLFRELVYATWITTMYAIKALVITTRNYCIYRVIPQSFLSGTHLFWITTHHPLINFFLMYYNIHCLPLTIKQHIKIINLLYLLCCGQQWCDCIRVAVIWNHSNYVTVTVLIYALQSSHDLGHMNYNSEFKNLAMVNLWNLVSAAAILSNLLKTPSKVWYELNNWSIVDLGPVQALTKFRALKLKNRMWGRFSLC